VRRSTKILLAGFGLSALVLAAGYLNTIRLRQHEDALKAECGAPVQKSAGGATADAHGPWEKYAADKWRKLADLPPPPAGYILDSPKIESPSEAGVVAKLIQSGELAGNAREYALQALRRWDASQQHAPSEEDAQGHFVPFCDAEELSNVEVKAGGIQAKIVEAHRAVTDSKTWPLTVALAVFVLGALPWAWYALLRRIGELRAAIGGKPPEL
jgi:hypothetical protein